MIPESHSQAESALDQTQKQKESGGALRRFLRTPEGAGVGAALSLSIVSLVAVLVYVSELRHELGSLRNRQEQLERTREAEHERLRRELAETRRDLEGLLANERALSRRLERLTSLWSQSLADFERSATNTSGGPTAGKAPPVPKTQRSGLPEASEEGRVPPTPPSKSTQPPKPSNSSPAPAKPRPVVPKPSGLLGPESSPERSAVVPADSAGGALGRPQGSGAVTKPSAATAGAPGDTQQEQEKALEAAFDPQVTPWIERLERSIARLQSGGSDRERSALRNHLRAALREGLSEVQDSPGLLSWLVQTCEGSSAVRRDTVAASLVSTAARLYARYLVEQATGPETAARALAFATKRGFEEEAEQARAVLALVEPVSGVDPTWLSEREARRKQRQAVLEEVRRYLARRGLHAARAIERFLDAVERQAPVREATWEEIERLIDATLAESPKQRHALRARVERLRQRQRNIEAESEGKSAEQDAMERRLAALRTRLARPLLGAIDRCLEAGEPGYAFDLLQLLLTIDPENARAHRGLGHVRVGGRWVRRFEAKRIREGWAWDRRWGWIRARARKRYERGAYFDLTKRAWASLADWERVHASPENPWRIRTEHFELLSTAPLAVAVKAAERLEAFFMQAFRQFDLVFAPRGDPRGARLVFGEVEGGRALTVWLYRDDVQFREHAKPPVGWAAGFYSPARSASFFYAQGSGFSVGTLQHETTHQILGEFGGRGAAPSWLAEGAAVYLEACRFDSGARMRVARLDEHGMLRTYRDRLRSGESEHSFATITRYITSSQWDSGDISANYRGAGAAFYFLMHFDGGRYRADTVEYLRDAYRGSTNRSIEAYVGLSTRSLDALMRRFYLTGGAR